MDNDNKINFTLDAPLTSTVKPGNIYDIELEYARTAKNRSWFVILLIGGLLIVTVTGVWIAHYQIDKNIHSVTVDIETFANINLKNLLDRTARIQSQYDAAVEAKTHLELTYKENMNMLDTMAQGDKDMVRSLGLKADEERARLAEIERKLAGDKAALEKSYLEEAASLDAEIADYGEQIANFDHDKIREAQENQSFVNAALVRSNLEKEQLRLQYEAQIDAFRMRIGSIQKSVQRSQTEYKKGISDSNNERILALNEAIESNIAEYERMQSEYDALVADRDAARINNSALTAERDAAQAALRHSETLLERYMSFFRTLAGRNGDAGYIVDTNQNGMLVYVDPVYGTSFNGKRAYVFRSGNDYIGSISLTGISGEIQATVIEQASGRSFQVNDRILLDMAQ